MTPSSNDHATTRPSDYVTTRLRDADHATKSIFFSGKGGVGKTSMACATAVRFADEGKRTLIVTTDPASNLADVFEQSIGHQITPIKDVPNLWAMEIDPDRATQEYVDRALAPIRAAFPPQIVQVIEEQMSGPCTAEVAAFDRFTDFIVLDAGAPKFDVIIFDTAPTGHTLRMLELPAEWTRSINLAEQGSGQTCIGPTAAIQSAKLKYERALAMLRDAAQTTFIFVLHPEAIAIRETERAIGELGKLGIHAHQLIVNGLIPPQEKANSLFAARAEMQARYLKQIETKLPYPARRMFLLDGEIKGVERLREAAGLLLNGRQPAPNGHHVIAPTLSATPALDPSAIRARLSPDGHNRVIFFAGKGGVGKTVASCLTAVWLARQGHRTLLLTTDPAAHLGDVLGVPVGDEAAPVRPRVRSDDFSRPGKKATEVATTVATTNGDELRLPSLWAAKIDPKMAAEAYKARILNDARQRGRPPEAIRVMAEELESPCTEEMAAFDRFIDFASQDEWEVIVFDTAPTGHTLRLLELPMDWSKQLDVKVFATVDAAAADDVAKQHFDEVIAMMRDPARSTFAFVMYPEATPIIEAYRASEELRGLGIPTGLVVANFVIPPEQATTPFIRARRAMQEKYLIEIANRFAAPVLQIPLLPAEVKGLEMLIELGASIFGEGEANGNDPIRIPVFARGVV